jgi:anti-anti-sigma factor
MSEGGMDHIKVDLSELAPLTWEIAIGGSLDWSNFAKVETALEGLFQRGVYRIVVNLKDCKYISSAGFGCFIGSLDTANKNGGDMIFASTPPEIQDVFNILGLARILRFAEDSKAALAQFSKK